MRRPIVALILSWLLPAAAAFAGDDRASPPRIADNGQRTTDNGQGDQVAPPRIPPPGVVAPTATVDEARLAELVDRAVERALSRREASSLAAPSGQSPVYAAPQSVAAAVPTTRVVRRIVPAEARSTIAYQPVEVREARYAQVLVPPCAPRRAIAAVGEMMVECGRPRLRTYRLAPAAVVDAIEECPPAIAAAPVRTSYASPQAPGK